MEPITLQFLGQCFNAGGLFTLAGVLFYLVNRLLNQQEKTLMFFNQALDAEREQCHEDHEAILETVRRNHEAVMNLWRK
jgi:hypothetical protein